MEPTLKQAQPTMPEEGRCTAKTQCDLLVLPWERPSNPFFESIYSVSVLIFRWKSHNVAQTGLRHVSFSDLDVSLLSHWDYGYTIPCFTLILNMTVTNVGISSPHLRRTSISK